MNILQRDELQDWEFDAEGHDQEELQQRFQIDGLDSLNWAFRKLAAIKAKNDEIGQLVERELDRIRTWEQEQKKYIKADMEFFEGLIGEYHAKQLAADPKAKTISTPYGASKSRASKAAVDKADETALLQYAKENGMKECIKESLKWADMKKQLKVVSVGGNEVVVDENGELVPGAIVKPASISFSVEVK
jgi:hypothetical protein